VPDKDTMNLENPVPSNGLASIGEDETKPIVPPSELPKWQQSINKGLDDAAFQYSVSEYEREQAEKRANGHVASSSATQFQTDAEKVVEEEVVRHLNKPLTQTPTEPAGQISSDTAVLESSGA
jgi:hypothetical protein